MTDDALRSLALDAGLQPEWEDTEGRRREVGAETLRAVLGALGLPAATDALVNASRARLAAERAAPAAAPLLVMRAGAPLSLPAGVSGGWARVSFEQGGVVEFALGDGAPPRIDRPGYHRLAMRDRELTLAVAPPAARTSADAGRGALLWGLAAQIYGLRGSNGDGSGDFGAVAEFAESAARHGADMVALSPSHAQFLADLDHYSPYSPSSRLFHNALYADPVMVFGSERVLAAVGDRALAEDGELIAWATTARGRVERLRALFDHFCLTDVASATPLAADFVAFRADGGPALASHAVFEALHAREYGRDFTKWRWRDWPAELADARSPAVAAFAQGNQREVDFHIFCQWLVARSMAQAQGRALSAGMRVGLVSDLAVGMNAGGSHAWSRPDDLLLGLSIGAPPDMLAPLGQNWGLTTFSPRALQTTGYAPFLATLRAALRNAGGVRIDHVMGLMRLWLVPDGAAATEGVYLAYPFDDLLALTCLESRRHAAIVIGEDLGTVPHGMRDRLGAAGLAGMRVFQFERAHGRFHPPGHYPADAVAMTGTHDTATIAGWWRGLDLALRGAVGHLPPGRTLAACEEERAGERAMAWTAFREAGVAGGDAPAVEDAAPAVDAAALFVASTPATLAILPLEDALALPDQPNLPGTIDEHPNWRRRYPGQAREMLDRPDVAARLARFDARRKRKG